MKKLLILPLTLLLGFLLVACSQDKESDSGKKTDNAEKTAEETSKDESLKVDKGLLNVEVTIPASFYEGQDIDKAITEAKKEGIKEAIKNDDGSVTYKMSKSVHNKMMKELEKSVLETVEEIKTSDDFTSIKDVTYNKSFSEFTLTVNKEEFESSFDAMSSMGLAIVGMYYQLFGGTDPEKFKVTVIFKDESNGEVINKVVYPDDLNDSK
ncbi:membrane lipoprotein lipid attachment site-containing protein [Lysinibacillus sp. CTST325]